MEREEGRGSRRAALVFGGLLIIGGVALLAAQLYGYDLRIDIDRIGWPAFVIVPGLLMLITGLVLSDEPGVGLSIAGGIITTVGLILGYQLLSDHFASWAYAWALVAPTSVGLSMMLWGGLHLRGGMFRSGLVSLGVGLVLFLVLFAFFEGVLNIGRERGLAAYGRQALPFALIVAGALVLLGRLWPSRRRRRWEAAWQQGDWQAGGWPAGPPPTAPEAAAPLAPEPAEPPLDRPVEPTAPPEEDGRPG
jgi:hypothetical protein